MTRSLAHGRITAIIATALALSAAAPVAEATPAPPGSAGSSAASHPMPAPASAVHLTNGHAARGISDWGYVAIGSGVACLVLIGAGGTRVLSRRRRRRPAAVRPRVAG